MMLQFSAKPGPAERHLQRKMNNPLFGDSALISQRDIDAAQQKDSAAVEQFRQYFHETVQKVVKLEKSVDSELILTLKAQLEQLYAVSTGLQGKPEQIPDAIRKLIDAINSSMRSAAANDADALEKMDRDDEQTRLHFYLSDFLVVSDLLNPERAISDEEFVPTLLNEDEAGLRAALALFPPEMIAEMIEQAGLLLKKIEIDGHDLPHAWDRLAQMENWLVGK